MNMKNKIKVRILKSQFEEIIIVNEGNYSHPRESQLNIRVMGHEAVVLTPKNLKPFNNPLKAVKYLMKYEKDRTRSPYK